MSSAPEARPPKPLPCCCTMRSYGDDEYPNHVGWGHSSLADALEFAHKSRVGRLVLFRHDPYHTDDELEALLALVQTQRPGMQERVCLAYEGMTIAL